MLMSCLNQMSWIWRIFFFFLTAQFLEVCSFLMVNEHIYKFNRIVNLWNYLPFCLLSHKGGVKAGMFPGNNMCSVHMCGRLQLHCRSTKYWTVFVIWACSILFKRNSRSRWPEKMTSEKKKSGFWKQFVCHHLTFSNYPMPRSLTGSWGNPSF